MFMKRGGRSGNGTTPSGGSPTERPTTDPQVTPTGAPSPTQGQIPNAHQIPMADQPLTAEQRLPNSGPEALSGEAATTSLSETSGAGSLTLELVLASPTWAEDQLHASLMLRALRWLALLEQDDNSPPQPGKRVVGLDTQVDMFKVISEWLKTSKKTKGTGEDEKEAPGIEQMREVIRQELEKVPPSNETKPREFRPGVATPDELGDEDDFDAALIGDDEFTEEEEAAVKRDKQNAYQRDRRTGKVKAPILAARGADSNELDIMINRARKAAFEED